MPCVACALPSIYLVCMVFGTAIPTSLVCMHFVAVQQCPTGTYIFSMHVCMYDSVFVEDGLNPIKSFRLTSSQHVCN